jgi:hypothetical protein
MNAGGIFGPERRKVARYKNQLHYTERETTSLLLFYYILTISENVSI